MRRSSTLKTLIGLSILAAALALSLATADPEALAPGDGDAVVERREGARREARRVETVAVAPATARATLRFAGTVRPVRRAVLGFTVSGRLVARPVEVGDRVEAGSVLGRLEAEPLDNPLRSAEAAAAEAAARAAQAERERLRVERLAEARAATDEELEQARTAADSAAAAARRAEADLREARRRSAEATLTAPWRGTVREVQAEPGEFLAAGQPVLELAGDGALEVELGLPEALLGEVAVGDRVGVLLPFGDGDGAGGTRYAGTVRSLGRAAAGAGSLFPAVVDLPAEAGLVPGSTVEVMVARAPSGGLAVPLAAVLNPGGGQPSVFAVRGGIARRVAVRVATLLSGGVVVAGASGSAADDALRTGDRVVVAGHLGLIDGDRVEAVPAAAVSAAEPGPLETSGRVSTASDSAAASPVVGGPSPLAEEAAR